MSLIQGIIGSAVGVVTPPPPQGPYPNMGSNYPVSHSAMSSGIAQAAPAYYSSISADNVGLLRRAFNGTAITGGAIDANWPSTYSVAQQGRDQYVGFGYAIDGATNYTMEWVGYFKPAVSGDFNFAWSVDDYLCFWIGATAVSGWTWGNSYVGASNGAGYFPLVAGRYYPVRILYTEMSGGNDCTIWTGLNNQVPVHNADAAAIGQFFCDADQNTGAAIFPGSGLVT